MIAATILVAVVDTFVAWKLSELLLKETIEAIKDDSEILANIRAYLMIMLFMGVATPRVIKWLGGL